MQQDRLAIQVFKRAVFCGRNREEFQLAELKDDANWGFSPLHGRIGRAETDIHLAAQNCLDGQFLVRKRGPFVIQTVGLGAVKRHKESRKFIGWRFSQRDANFVSIGSAKRKSKHQRNRRSDDGHLANELFHLSPPRDRVC